MKKLMLLFMLLLSGAPVLAADDTAAAATAAAPSAGVPWSSLDSQQRQLLAQFESRWGDLPPQRQFALSRGAARWLQMNADEKARATRPLPSLARPVGTAPRADPRALE